MNQLELTTGTPPPPGVRPAASTARPATTAACGALEMTGRPGNPRCSRFLSDDVNQSKLRFSFIASPLRSDTVVYRGTEDRSFHGSNPRLDHPLSTHSSLHQIDSHSRHSSQRDVSEAPPTLITHGTTASDGRAAENEGTSAWDTGSVKGWRREADTQQSVCVFSFLRMGNVSLSAVLVICGCLWAVTMTPLNVDGVWL